MAMWTNESGCTTRGARCLAYAVLAAVLVIAVPLSARADDAPDYDGDGVADAVDACPDTDPADLISPDGCPIVSCEGGLGGSGWSSTGAYADYVAAWVKGARASNKLTGREARSILRRARKSTCGDASQVRCCVFALFDDDIGRCRIMTEDACEALDDQLFESDGEADDEGPGSCLPNPCVF